LQTLDGSSIVLTGVFRSKCTMNCNPLENLYRGSPWYIGLTCFAYSSLPNSNQQRSLAVFLSWPPAKPFAALLDCDKHTPHNLLHDISQWL
jgi:hypothetical protein